MDTVGKKSARVKRVTPSMSAIFTSQRSRLTCHARFLVPFFVMPVRFVFRHLYHAWLLTVPNVPLRQFLVFQESILKRKAFLFPLTPFFVVKIDVGSLKEYYGRQSLVEQCCIYGG